VPERFAKPQEPQATTIWPCNLAAFEVFCDCGSQWRYVVPFGDHPKPMGIERTALASSMDMLGVQDRRDTLQRVQVMESAALAVMQRRK